MNTVDVVFVKRFRGSRSAEAGDVWRGVDPRMALALVQGGYAEPQKRTEVQRAVEPVYIGGGWYQLPEGQRVRGRPLPEMADE
jgi:hypothetical protein